jgi:cell division protein FtsB
MAAARTTRRSSTAARGSARRRGAPPPRGIRWDRLGRIALLFVLALVLYLYLAPTRSLVATWNESKQRRAQVTKLERANKRLRARRDALHKPATLEREARRLGMVRAGEKSYVVEGVRRR